MARNMCPFGIVEKRGKRIRASPHDISLHYRAGFDASMQKEGLPTGRLLLKHSL